MEVMDLHTTSPMLHFAEDKLQIIALTFMAVIYVFKIRWILSFKAGKERQAATGNPRTTAKKGAVYSLFNIFMPWSIPWWGVDDGRTEANRGEGGQKEGYLSHPCYFGYPEKTMRSAHCIGKEVSGIPD